MLRALSRHRHAARRGSKTFCEDRTEPIEPASSVNILELFMSIEYRLYIQRLSTDEDRELRKSRERKGGIYERSRAVNNRHNNSSGATLALMLDVQRETPAKKAHISVIGYNLG